MTDEATQSICIACFIQFMVPTKSAILDYSLFHPDHARSQTRTQQWDLARECSTGKTNNKGNANFWKLSATNRVLAPPAGHHNRHIETKHEGQRNQIRVSIAIFDDGLECFLLVFIKYQSVGDVEGVVDKEEWGQIEPHQLINRASPSVNEKKNP